ncbi:MAG: hypothetical protein M1133_04850 [Armatimonadetes bacterium]|nr:hypothetical protein [Armatimonadota bacterium]
MKRALLITLAIMVIAAPAFAGVWVHPTTPIKPLVPCTSAGGPAIVPGVLCLDPGFELVVDKLTGNPIIDPITGKQAVAATFQNYMSASKIPGVIATYQSTILEKHHPVRKAACNFQWPADPRDQIGKDNINLCWPLLYETDGTNFVLIVNYSTNKPVVLNNMRASRIHTEVYTWEIEWNTWADLEARIAYFSIHPAGVCELFAINLPVVQRIAWFIDGAPAIPGPPAPPVINSVLGIKGLITAGKYSEAAIRFGQLEAFIDEMGCIDPCDYAQGQPVKGALGISNNSVLPVASILLNDIWAVGKATGILTDLN